VKIESELAIVVAHDQNLGIGKDGRLPWHLSQDLKRFREVTTRSHGSNFPNGVIMGYKTWRSLPDSVRPLPDRFNCVLSHLHQSEITEADRVLVANSFSEAIAKLKAKSCPRIFVIGGGEIFKLAIEYPSVNYLYVTEVQGVFNCDTFFPEYRLQFEESGNIETLREGDIQFRFSNFRRKGNRA
jgi:dihydrofolate reductase/thymidylate synthase